MLALLAQDLSFFVIGLLYACRSLTTNLLEIPSGALADGYGRRHTLIGSFVAYATSFAVFALAPNVAFLFLAMILYAIGDSFRTGTHKAMIFEWLRLQGREAERTKVYGVTRSWSKFGSASSTILAAIFVLITDDFQTVFLFAIVPYLFNIVNLIGYPAELDGMVYRQNISGSFSHFGGRLVKTLRRSLSIREIRRLIAESMAWEGVFGAVKDYLQPALVLLVVSFAVGDVAPSNLVQEGVFDKAPSGASTEVRPSVVVAVAVVYSVLFLASGIASQLSHRIVTRAGSISQATQWLWTANLGVFVAFALADLLKWLPIVVLAFVALAILQNIWRPILIGRFDEYSDPKHGATILSIESQAQRLATFVVAPIAGLAIDLAARQNTIGYFWPLAIIGAAASLAILLTHSKFYIDQATGG